MYTDPYKHGLLFTYRFLGGLLFGGRGLCAYSAAWYLCCKPVGEAVPGGVVDGSPPIGVQGRSPGRGSEGRSPPEAEAL